MKRFRFRLEAVLTLRRHKEKLAQQNVARLAQREQELVVREAQLVVALREAELQAAREPRLAGFARAYYANASRARDAVQEERRTLVVELEAARSAWTLSRKERRVLESLRERRYEDWQQDCARSEQRELEELASAIRAAKDKNREARAKPEPGARSRMEAKP